MPDGSARLLLILGDQLDRRILDWLDYVPDRDRVAMFEVAEEATHVPSHKARTALFLSAMRHFARRLEDDHEALEVHYVALDDADNSGSFAGELQRFAAAHHPAAEIDTLVVLRPGEHRVLASLEAAANALGWRIDLREDPRFYTTPDDFTAWADGRKELVLEYFYREQRKRFGILMDDGSPTGGDWNYDAQNREALRDDAPKIPPRLSFEPDEVTREVFEVVESTFPDAPGSLDSFGWPVTREQALEALDHFLEHRLPNFGTYQDAMRRGEPWLWHSLLSPALNLGLIDPREAVDGALARYEDDAAPLNAVEGFVRQILGWREFIRGVYWHQGADYADRNHLEADTELPSIYWTGDTEMECMRQSLGQVHEHGYGHHIQRLMVTGLFALQLGVVPRQVADWYLGLYVDGVDWVTLPNTVGMVLYADGGVVGTKPYAATGKYIRRMSDYCGACPFDPDQRTGDEACPFSTLYWDFLMRQRDRLEGNRRIGFVWRNVDRLDETEQHAIGSRADAIRARLDAGEPLTPG
ncbi:MAG: cryptochrome/photolyase family protein [Acidobacteriota bacterium]